MKKVFTKISIITIIIVSTCILSINKGNTQDAKKDLSNKLSNHTTYITIKKDEILKDNCKVDGNEDGAPHPSAFSGGTALNWHVYVSCTGDIPDGVTATIQESTTQSGTLIETNGNLYTFANYDDPAGVPPSRVVPSDGTPTMFAISTRPGDGSCLNGATAVSYVVFDLLANGGENPSEGYTDQVTSPTNPDIKGCP